MSLINMLKVTVIEFFESHKSEIFDSNLAAAQHPAAAKDALRRREQAEVHHHLI